MIVRSEVHRMGFRYKLHTSILPANPIEFSDINQSRFTVVLAHAQMQYGNVKPKTNA